MSSLVFIPTEALWNWFDVGAYLKAVIEARTEILRRATIESGWFPHAAGEDRSQSIGLFQQSTRGWGPDAR